MDFFCQLSCVVLKYEWVKVFLTSYGGWSGKWKSLFLFYRNDLLQKQVIRNND